MYVDWEYYKIFYYVAKYQNFTRAARVLGNNQPNITHAMNRLESQLNCTLIERTQGGAGGSQSHLTGRARTLLERFAAYERRIREDADALYGEYFGGLFE